MYSASAISGAASEPRYVISEFNAIITHQEQQTQGWGETEWIKGVYTEDLKKKKSGGDSIILLSQNIVFHV